MFQTGCSIHAIQVIAVQCHRGKTSQQQPRDTLDQDPVGQAHGATETKPPELGQCVCGPEGVVPERVYFMLVDANYVSPDRDKYNYEFKHMDLKKYGFTMPSGKFIPRADIDCGHTSLPCNDFIVASDLSKDGLNVLVSLEMFEAAYIFLPTAVT